MRILSLFTQHRPNRDKQRGFYIAPALATVVIVGLISVAVYGIFRYINDSFTVTIENKNLMSIVSGARSLKQAGSYVNVDNPALQRIQAFGNMTGSATGGTVRNRWGGTVDVTGTASELQIQYNGVPANACQRFLISAADSGEFATPLPTCNDTGTTDLTFVVY